MSPPPRRWRPRSRRCVYRIHDAPSLAKLEALREFLGLDRAVAAEGRQPAPVALQPDPGARAQDAEHAQPGQRSGAALAGAGRVQPGQHRPFRPEPPPLRAFHLADPPLCRPHRPSRADPRAELGAGRAAATEARPSCPRSPAQISAAERRAMAAERDTVDRLIAACSPTASARRSPAASRGVTRAGLFVQLDETGADGFVPMSHARQRLLRHDEGATR